MKQYRLDKEEVGDDAITTMSSSAEILQQDDNSSIHEVLEELYRSTSYTVNLMPSKIMDDTLSALYAPAHQSFFVIQHALRIQLLNKSKQQQQQQQQQQQVTLCYTDYIIIALSHCVHLLKSGYEFYIPASGDYGIEKVIINIQQQQSSTENNNNNNNSEIFGFPIRLLQPNVLFRIMKKDKNDNDDGRSPDGEWRRVSAFLTNQHQVRYDSSRNIAERILQVSQKYQTQQQYKNNHDAKMIHRYLVILYEHLKLGLGTDLRDRASGDVALTIAMASSTIIGTTDTSQTTISLLSRILDVLAHVAALEIQRKSIRPSRKAADILYVVERIAAAGIVRKYNAELYNPYADLLYRSAAESLVGSKGYDNDNNSSGLEKTLELLKTGDFGLTTGHRAMLCLFRRFSTLYPRITPTDVASSLHVDDLLSDELRIIQFDDVLNRPYVVDIGCGLGLSLMGLSYMTNSSSAALLSQKTDFDLDYWSQCNYLGGDVNPRAIRWAQSTAEMWKLNGRLQFCHATAQVLSEYLHRQLQPNTRNKVPIRLGLLVLQFPTPYRLKEDKDTGNIYLPASPEDETFMANKSTLASMVNLMKQQQENDQSGHIPCHLLAQSNCEDVALYIYDALEELGLVAVEWTNDFVSNEIIHACDKRNESSRTAAWLEEQQRRQKQEEKEEAVKIRRATGKVWSSIPIVPAMTETEVAMEHAGTPVHRCLFRLP
jgi:hypothetical protein